MIKKFYEIVYNNINNDEYIEYREFQPRKKNNFTKSIDELIKNTQDKIDTYFGVWVRKSTSGSGREIYSNVFPIDIDFHKDILTGREYDFTDEKDVKTVEKLKEMVVSNIIRDNYLSQFFTLIDSGRGVHLYYRLPNKIYKKEWTKLMSNLFDYVDTNKSIKAYLDKNIKDSARIMRCPGSINKKTGTTSSILYFEEKTISDDFYEMLLKGRKKGKCGTYPVSRAMELCGLDPEEFPGKTATFCPFPDHHDEDGNNPSFVYYPETDTYWCWVDSQKDRGFNGMDFLKNMKRSDLMPTLEKESEINNFDGFALSDDGKLWDISDRKKLLVDFKSNKIIDVDTEFYGRKVFIDLGRKTVDISDYPALKKLKKRYFDIREACVVKITDSKLPEAIDIFISKAQRSDKRLIFSPGINKLNDDVCFHINGNTYPRKKDDVIVFNNEISKIYPRRECDINKFIYHLICDGNYTHVLAFLWGVSTIAKDIIIEKGNMFPILVATGITNSGKSLLGRMVSSMFGINSSEELDVPLFTMVKKLERYGTFPIHFDEFGDKVREREHMETLKDLSTRETKMSERANLTENTTKYTLRCPIIITGEKNILDAGLIKRSIVLNLGRNTHVSGNGEHFREWVKYCKDFKLLSFMEDFIENEFDTFRDIFKSGLTLDRCDLKIQVLNKTLDYLIDRGYIEHDLVDKSNIKTILEASEEYSASLKPNTYTEILSEILSVDFDRSYIDRYDIDNLINKIFFFDIEKGYVLVNNNNLYNYYKSIKRYNNMKAENMMSMITSFVQSPDYITTLKTRIRIKILNTSTDMCETKQWSNVLILKVSELNKEYLRIVLKYKLMRIILDDKELDKEVNTILENSIKHGVFVKTTNTITVI